MNSINCINCGEETEVKTPRGRFCSDRCRSAFYRKNNSISNQKLHEKLCEIDAKIDALLQQNRITPKPGPIDHFEIYEGRIDAAISVNQLMGLEESIAMNRFLSGTNKAKLMEMVKLKKIALEG